MAGLQQVARALEHGHLSTLDTQATQVMKRVYEAKSQKEITQAGLLEIAVLMPKTECGDSRPIHPTPSPTHKTLMSRIRMPPIHRAIPTAIPTPMTTPMATPMATPMDNDSDHDSDNDSSDETDEPPRTRSSTKRKFVDLRATCANLRKRIRVR